MEATPRRTTCRPGARRGRLATALAVAVLVPAGAAAAAPSVSGADGDVWNMANPVPTYVVTSAEPEGRVLWAVPGVGAGAGVSPVTVTLSAIPDGAHTLTVRELGGTADDDAGRTARRTFRVDRTPPTITIARPTGGLSVTAGTPVTVDYGCEGAISCTGTVPDGALLDTSREGSGVFAVTAMDDAGNAAGSTVAFTVLAAPAAPPPLAPALPAPAAPVGSAGTPVPTAPAGGGVTRAPGAVPVAPVRELTPATLHARLLRPRAGARLATRRPVLRWKRRAGARLYNVQVYRVTGRGRLTKVLSVFPRTTRVRVAPRRLSAGTRYIWRVWPFVSGRYTRQPLGVSWFRVRG